MDTLAPIRPQDRTTQAAEGLPRWRWTTAELVRLTELGAFADTDRFELIGGEIVPMSPVGRRHAIIADRLARRWTKLDVPGVHVAAECQFNLNETTYTEPDVLVWPATFDVPDVRGPDAFLVVEVADTSLRKDRTFKRSLYAAYGVREYWVIDAETLSTRVHLGLTNGDYADVVDVAAADMLTPVLAPTLALRLADLGL